MDNCLLSLQGQVGVQPVAVGTGQTPRYIQRFNKSLAVANEQTSSKMRKISFGDHLAVASGIAVEKDNL